MKRLSEKTFRNYVSNVAIIFMLVCLFSLTYLGGTVRVFSSNDYEVLYHGNLSNKNISLMINVYMGTEYIVPIIEILEQYNAKATFFVGGSWVVKNSDILSKIDCAGHEIGNHGYWHKDHKNLNQDQNQNEMFLTHEIVKNTIGKDMLLFAPPSGSYSQTTLKVASNMGYKTIMWTKDTIDWRDQDIDLIYERATKNHNGGDFILMHPTKSTVDALENIVRFYINNGYKLTTVSENIA